MDISDCTVIYVISFIQLLFLILLYVIGSWKHNSFHKRKITSLRPLMPFYGNVLPWFPGFKWEYFHEFILRTYKKFKDLPYGGIFYYRQPIVLLRDPQLIHNITVKDFEHFSEHQTLFNKEEPVWGKTLSSLTGKCWKDVRSAMNPILKSTKMFVLVNECSQQLVNFLEQCHKQPPCQGSDIQKDGEVLILELRDLYTRYSNDVIATTAFGIGIDSLKQPNTEFLQMGQKVFSKSTSWKIWSINMMGKLSVHEKVSDFFQKTISTQEQEGIVSPDLIQSLLQVKDGSSGEESTELDNDETAAQALVFFLEAFETSSTLLCFASHQLAAHPEMQNKLQEEVDKTLENNGGKLTYEAVNEMKYLHMVISETLRMFPPTVVSDRLCVKPYSVEMEGHTLELVPGDTLYIPIYALHHDPKYFTDPERFDPERFSEENKQDMEPLAYLPFGEGPRSCIGNEFALMETKLTLVHLLSRFNFKVVAKSPMPMKIIDTGFNNMSVQGGFWFGLEFRNSDTK